jgi:putative copper export protein
MQCLHKSGAGEPPLLLSTGQIELQTLRLRLRRGGSPKSILALVGAVLACFAFALTGHTSVGVHRLALAGLLMLHVYVVAFWFGALVPLYLASSRETLARAWELTERFTRVATWVVPVILLAGSTMAYPLLPNVAALREPCGQLLITKVVGFALLMGLAAANNGDSGPPSPRDPRTVGGGFVERCPPNVS